MRSVMVHGSAWCVSFSGGREEVDESVRVCG